MLETAILTLFFFILLYSIFAITTTTITIMNMQLKFFCVKNCKQTAVIVIYYNQTNNV